MPDQYGRVLPESRAFGMLGGLGQPPVSAAPQPLAEAPMSQARAGPLATQAQRIAALGFTSQPQGLGGGVPAGLTGPTAAPPTLQPLGGAPAAPVGPAAAPTGLAAPSVGGKPSLTPQELARLEQLLIEQVDAREIDQDEADAILAEARAKVVPPAGPGPAQPPGFLPMPRLDKYGFVIVPGEPTPGEASILGSPPLKGLTPPTMEGAAQPWTDPDAYREYHRQNVLRRYQAGEITYEQGQAELGLATTDINYKPPRQPVTPQPLGGVSRVPGRLGGQLSVGGSPQGLSQPGRNGGGYPSFIREAVGSNVLNRLSETPRVSLPALGSLPYRSAQTRAIQTPTERSFYETGVALQGLPVPSFLEEEREATSVGAPRRAQAKYRPWRFSF